MEKLPEKWSVERTPENYKQVNEWASVAYGEQLSESTGYVYCVNGIVGPIYNSWYLAISGYTIFTNSQFMQLVYNPWKQAQNSDGWVKCSVRNPDKDNKDYKYIVFDPKDISDDKIVIAFYWPIKGEWTNDYGEIIHPTHWRELPAPPKD